MTIDLSGLTTIQLTQLQSDFFNCLRAVSANQSYSMSGRSFSRANLREVSEMLAAINRAIGMNDGSLQRTVHADMSNP